MLPDYIKFLEGKRKAHIDSGFEVAEERLNKSLFPFQKFCVCKGLSAGKFAFFEDCGLGKTIQQLEWAHQVVLKTDMPVMILAPLAVSGQTIQEGNKFGIEVKHWNIHWQDRYEDCNSKMQRGGIFIDNYEQLENINCDLFSGIVLDESSIIKFHEGAIRNAVIEKFKNTPYKLCCTATPSPNDPMELGNHSEFLNVMSRNEMLAMYFVHDGGETSKWRIKGHAEQAFWNWVSTWAIMLNKPSDIGYADEGYNLPELNIVEKKLITPKKNNGQLFNETAVSAITFNHELRITLVSRMDEAIEIVNNSLEPFIVWIKHNGEGEYLMKNIPDAYEVKGSDSKEWKEDKLLGFANNEYRVLVTKSRIAQFGLNFQTCNNQIFASLDFSFEALYQSIRRSWRFGQKNQVNIFIITTDTMTNVIESIKQKQEQFRVMQEAMAEATNKSVTQKRKYLMGREFEEYKGNNFSLQLGDCVQLIQNLPDESIDLSVFSPPFASLYTYSDELEDMGNSKNFNEFVTAFGFLVKELFRVIKTGRNIVVHCMDLPIQKGKEGYIGLRDFTGMIRETFEKEGFVYHSRCTAWRNPVTEMQRTKALGLLHKQLKKDAAMSRMGLPDYLLAFRKDGESVSPVHVDIPVDLWQKWASPVWMDIDFGNTLNGRAAREEKDEKHIAPLSLDIIERVIALWSNEGDTVFSPFAGIGSELYQAVKMNRKGLGFELKKSYFDQAVKNCMEAELSKKQGLMFS